MNKLTPIMSMVTLAESKLIPMWNKLQLTQQGNKLPFHFNGQTNQIALWIPPKQFAPGSAFLFCKQNTLPFPFSGNFSIV
jgi:hypothetical protein